MATINNDAALLEALAEAIRQRRRSYVVPFDLSSVVIDAENSRLELEIVLQGYVHTYTLTLKEVVDTEHDKSK